MYIGKILESTVAGTAMIAGGPAGAGIGKVAGKVAGDMLKGKFTA